MNIIKTFNLLKENKGLTLIELMLAIAISGTIIIALGSLFTSGFRFFNFIEQKTLTQQDFRFLGNYLSENLRFTHMLQIEDNFSDGKMNLDSGEKIIGQMNSKFRFKKYGSSERVILELPDSINIYFKKNIGKLTSIILYLEENNTIKFKKHIILNNCKPEDIIDDSTMDKPNTLIFSN